MKKIITLFIILITFINIEVKAANYQIKELIPLDTPTTIVTDNFSYKSFYYKDYKIEGEVMKNNLILFKGIKNISDKDLPVSISIGLFDKNKLNIGIINYCSTSDDISEVAGTILKKDEEKEYVIEVNEKNLADNKTIQDIKYIAILGDNINCRSTGSLEFIGKKVEDIKLSNTSLLENNHTQLVIKLFTILIIFLIIIFLYKFLFTTSFSNFNGDDFRKGYAKRNKSLQKERAKNAPIKEPKKPSSNKSQKIREQELKERKEENKETSDLHNMYK